MRTRPSVLFFTLYIFGVTKKATYIIVTIHCQTFTTFPRQLKVRLCIKIYAYLRLFSLYILYLAVKWSHVFLCSRCTQLHDMFYCMPTFFLTKSCFAMIITNYVATTIFTNLYVTINVININVLTYSVSNIYFDLLL